MKKWATIKRLLNEKMPKELINPPSKFVFGDWWKGSAAIESANQIFGAENWTDKLMYVVDRPLPDGSGILYEACVTVTAFGKDDDGGVQSVSHDGLGVGVAQATFDKQNKVYLPLKPMVVRTAVMASKTYAIKRALRHFGLRMGAELYFEDEEELAFLDEEEKQKRRDEKAKETEGEPKAEKAKGPQYGPPVADSKGMLTIIRGKSKKPIGDLVGESDVKVIDHMTKVARALPQFTGHGPRFERHLKKHFDAEDVSTLNWGQMVALLVFGETGDRHADFYGKADPVKKATAVAATSAAIDEMAEIVAFMGENKVPESLIDDITSTHFADTLTPEDARVILASLRTAFAQLGGLDGICDKDGKMTPTLSTIILVAKPTPF